MNLEDSLLVTTDEQALGGWRAAWKGAFRCFVHVLDDSILDSQGCLLALGIIIRRAGGSEIEKRAFYSQRHIINVEIFNGDIRMTRKEVNEAS